MIKHNQTAVIQKPTMHLRWKKIPLELDINLKPLSYTSILQQKWIDNKGIEVWKEVEIFFEK
jgi:hypothetical protein